MKSTAYVERRRTRVDVWCWVPHTGRFVMFSEITNIYNQKTKGPALMELFTAIGKLKIFFFDMLTLVWQQLEYRIDVCRLTRGAHIEHL